MSNKRAWLIGGTTVVGIGVGFIFLQTSALFFVASIFIGIGLGLTIAALISREGQQLNVTLMLGQYLGHTCCHLARPI